MRTYARILRTFAALALAGAVVTGAIELGTPSAPRAIAAGPVAPYYREGELPAYPNALEFPLGEALAVNGLPVRISHFQTADRSEKVRDFYLDAFAREGAATRLTRTDDGGFSVAALIAGGSAQAVVVISPRSAGADVFPSVFPLSAAPGDFQVPDADVPFSDSAVGISRLSDSGATVGEVITYHEPTLKAPALAAFVRGEMGRRGWLHKGSGALPRKGEQVEMTRGGRSARFTIVPFSQEPTGATVVVKYGPSED